jgi:hypothetical protein
MKYETETGPLYEKAVKRLVKYRQIAARIPMAKAKTAGKLDRTLESLGESIGEILGELSDGERRALIGWRVGFVPDVFEVHHEELMEQPYASIRRVHRWTEEVDRYPSEEIEEEDTEEVKAQRYEELRKFLKLPNPLD